MTAGNEKAPEARQRPEAQNENPFQEISVIDDIQFYAPARGASA